jgi:hypothetical protein
MITVAPSTPASTPDAGSEPRPEPVVADLPPGYEAIRADPDTQFVPIEMKDVVPRKPSAFEEALRDFFEWLGDLLSPIGAFLSANWGVLQWVLLAGLVALVAYFALRLAGPLAVRNRAAAEEEAEPEWQPDREETLALLEEADRLAAEGKFDEAAHLLLKRSVGQIAAARPEWVEPSSTARELAALPRLSAAARRAFATISAAVERSLFALRSLGREDWEQARSAYADFALAQIDAGTADGDWPGGDRSPQRRRRSRR